MNKQQELAEQILEKHSLILSIETGGHFSKHLKIEEPKEYKAILAAIVEALNTPAKEVEAISDSELEQLANDAIPTHPYPDMEYPATAVTKFKRESWMDGYKAAKETISVPAQQGVSGNSIEHFVWKKQKPEFVAGSEECVLMTATYIRNYWDYTMFTIEKIEGEDDNGNYGWYYGILQDGSEWGDYDDLKADLYLTMPLLNAAAQPLQPSLEEKKEDLVASSSATSSDIGDAPVYDNNSIQQ